jgi:hypothetical protein
MQTEIMGTASAGDDMRAVLQARASNRYRVALHAEGELRICKKCWKRGVPEQRRSPWHLGVMQPRRRGI